MGQASLKTKTAQIPPFPPNKVDENIEKKNNNNFENSFRVASFQELFASKNSILQLKWR